jgi:hypothetical protein
MSALSVPFFSFGGIGYQANKVTTIFSNDPSNTISFTYASTRSLFAARLVP